MQVIPGDVLGDTKRPNTEELEDPEINIGAGAAILRQYTDYFDGRLRYGIAAYNVGPTRLKEKGISNKLPLYYIGRFEEVWRELWPGEPLPWATPSDRSFQVLPTDVAGFSIEEWLLPFETTTGVTSEAGDFPHETAPAQDWSVWLPYADDGFFVQSGVIW